MRYVESIRNALHQLTEQDKKVFILGEDIADPYGGAFKATKGLSTAFPDRVINTPISEGALTGLAIGMAVRGLKPILEIMFGDFLTLCADQLVNSATKLSWMYNGQVTVPLFIRTPMGGRRGYGPTHSQTLETLFLNVFGLKILAPSHFHDPGEILQKAVSVENSPIIFIENKTLYPMQIIKEGPDGKMRDFFARIKTRQSVNYPTISLVPVKDEPAQVVLVGYGGMAPILAEAALNVFLKEEIICEIIVPSLIKPVPILDILPSVRQSRNLIIVEESLRTAGWGAELSSQVYEDCFDILIKPIKRLGAKDSPVPSAKTLEVEMLPQVRDVEDAIYQQVGR